MHYRNTIGKKSGRQTGASANSEIDKDRLLNNFDVVQVSRILDNLSDKGIKGATVSELRPVARGEAKGVDTGSQESGSSDVTGNINWNIPDSDNSSGYPDNFEGSLPGPDIGSPDETQGDTESDDGPQDVAPVSMPKIKPVETTEKVESKSGGDGEKSIPEKADTPNNNNDEEKVAREAVVAEKKSPLKNPKVIGAAVVGGGILLGLMGGYNG